MRLIRTLGAFLLFALAYSAHAIPAVLIVRVKPNKGPALETSICDLLANEIQEGGFLVPIAWSPTDPIFRSAVESGKIKSGIDTPTLGQALDAARKLKAEYVLTTDMRAGDRKLLGAAALYKNGKLVWKDPENDLSGTLAHLRQMVKKGQMTQEQYDQAVLDASYRSSAVQVGAPYGSEDTLRSLARTWVQMFSTGPLLGLPKQPEKPTPDPGRGQQPVVPDPGVQPPTVAAQSQWAAEVDAALKAGDGAKAVILLRDAVDASPLDLQRRTRLVTTLVQQGRPDAAAQEARRACELMPDKIELRTLAARAWLEAGKPEEAQVDLNEAEARAPENPGTRRLLAHVAMAKGDFATAIRELDLSIKTSPVGDAYYLRALAHAMAGDADASMADGKKAAEVGLSQDPSDAESRYGLVAALVDDAIASIGDEIRALHQRALVQRANPEVSALRADLGKRVAGRSAFIDALPVPAGHETSHNRRVLAYKLLAQCLADLDSYLKTGNEDVLTDSRISLGEALKQGVSARRGLLEERQGAKKSNAGSG